MTTERHIFRGEISEGFATLVHDFHERFVDKMLICGVDKPGTALDSIKMTKNPNYGLDYYKKIVGGLMKFDPNIYVCAINEQNNLLAEMFLTRLNDKKTINNVFLMQNVYNWEGTNLFCAQVWKLKNNDLLDLNNYWLC